MGQGASTCFCGSSPQAPLPTQKRSLLPAGQGATKHPTPVKAPSSSPTAASELTSDSSSGSGSEWLTVSEGSGGGNQPQPLEAALEHLQVAIARAGPAKQPSTNQAPNSRNNCAASSSSRQASGKQAAAAAVVWDAAAASAAQSEVDHRHAAALDQVAASLSHALSAPGAAEDPPTAPPTPAGDSPLASTEAASQASVELTATAAAAPTVQRSCLVPYAVRQLQSCSITDITQRCRYYCSLLRVLQCLAEAADTLHLLHVEHGGCSAASCVLGLVPSAKRLQKLLVLAQGQGAVPLRAAAATPKGQGSAASQKGNPKPAGKEAPEADAMQVVALLLKLALTIKGGHDQPSQDDKPQPADQQRQDSPAASCCTSSSGASPREGDGSSRACSSSSSSSTGSSDGSSSSSSAAGSTWSYIDMLRPLQVQYLPTFPSSHTAATQTEPSGAPRARTVRVLREAAGLERLLPLNEESSVFVAVSEERATLWKALIVGPMGTPYAGGCFLFDIYFPPQYPACPPKVTLKTTGGGRVRFNPNLYKDGKVCLSLLGTWYGKKGEAWDPAASSVLQVLVSIQALILVEDPWFNEPGRAGERGKRYATNASHTHNKFLRENTIRLAMLDYLKAPPPEFADVIKAHFRLRGPAICGQIKAWMIDSDRGYVSRLSGLLSQLQDQLAKLGTE